MADYKWPEADKRSLIGKRISRIDGPHKVSGRAKYSYDIKREGMLYAKMVRCPHAHAKVAGIDTSTAEKIPGVKAVRIIQPVGTEIKWAGDDIVVVAAVDEPTAEDAVRAVKVQYEVLPHLVLDTEPPVAKVDEPHPLMMSDFRAFIARKAPDSEIIARIQKDGISADENVRGPVKTAGASEAVLEAIKNARLIDAGY